MKNKLLKQNKVMSELKTARNYSVKARHLKQAALQYKKQVKKDNKAN